MLEDVDRSWRLDSQGHTDAALDLLCDAVDDRLRSGEFVDVVRYRVEIPVDECSADILLGLLTATLPAKKKQPSRESFYRRVETALEGAWRTDARVVDRVEVNRRQSHERSDGTCLWLAFSSTSI